MGRVRTSMGAAALGLVALAATACPPPPPPAPTLPAGVGVQWLRDAGGTLEPAGYQAAWQRWSVLDGTVAGPTEGATPETVPATVWPALTGVAQLLPDGTAKFPWNGFAGEGVTDVTSPNGIWTDHTVSGPAGACTFTSTSGDLIMAIVPSPDAAKVAVLTRDAEWIGGPSPTVLKLVSLAPGCPVLATMTRSTSPGGRVTSAAVVWAPDSSAVVVPVSTGTDAWQLVRLDAVTGSSPSVVLDEPTARLVPLGWSVADRIAFARWSLPLGVGGFTSTLETIGLDGSGRARFDQLTTQRSFQALHVGAFVPGTTTVVYGDAGELRTNDVGEAVPWFRVRTYDDTTGGKGPLLATDPPFGWHDEGGGQVPNPEVVERFVR